MVTYKMGKICYNLLLPLYILILNVSFEDIRSTENDQLVNKSTSIFQIFLIVALGLN